MDDKLKAAIDKIKILAQQNKEFDCELRKVFGRQETSSAVGVSSNEVQRLIKIEKYLGLDYYVDSQQSTVDYSFITEPANRAQLISDNREMMRYRYGTRSHKIEFDEYCKYAQFQAELLLNIYYGKRNSCFKDIINHIKKYNPTAKLDNIKQLSAISFSVKVYSFFQENADNEYYDSATWNNIREVRNGVSHRSPEKESFSILAYRQKLLDYKLPLSHQGYVASSLLEDKIALKGIYESIIKNSNEYKMYKFLIWYNEQPYDEINEALSRLASIIKSTCYNVSL